MKHILITCIAAVVLPLCATQLKAGAEAPVAARGRIGIYDSRAVAIAYAGSPVHEAQIRTLQAEREKARAAGDDTTVARIDAEGRAQQETLHRQAFGAASVEDILVRIPDEVERLKRAEGVADLVSKWDTAALAKTGPAERVDMTAALVDALRPNERQRERAIAIQRTKPAAAEAVGAAR
jgi:hypothetical protein